MNLLYNGGQKMEDRQKDFLLYILGFVGLLVFLGGIFGLYDWKYGLFGGNYNLVWCWSIPKIFWITLKN